MDILYNSEIEQSVLSYLLVYESVLLIPTIKSEWFYDPINKKIFNSIKKLNDDGVEIGINTTTQEFISTYGETEANIIKLIAIRTPIEDISFAINKLRDLFERRLLVTGADTILSSANNLSLSVSDILTTFESGISSELDSNFSLMDSSNVQQMRASSLLERTKFSIIRTGFKDIDKHLVQGFHKGDLSVIAARPGIGKSLLKTNIIQNLCSAGFGVMSFCMDQDNIIELDRINSIRTGIPLAEILKNKYWSDDDPRYTKLLEDAKSISRWNFQFISCPGITLSQTINLIKRRKKSHPIDVVFYDLFDNLADIDLTNPNKIKEKIRDIKNVAISLNIHICLLVQIRRFPGKVKNIEEYRPTLRMLKDSGGFEEVARLILLLHRPKHYDSTIVQDDFEIEIAKQTNGPAPRRAKLLFDNATLRLYGKDDAPWTLMS